MFCGFVSGSVIINIISWTRVLKPCLNHCIPWNIYTYYYLKKAIVQRITNHAKALRCMQLGVVLVTEKDILENIACTHSFAMKAYERSGERANRLSSTFKAF